MKTFLQRLCLFGLLATTGFVLSNCQRQAEEEDAALERTGPSMSAGEGMRGAAADAGVVGSVDAGVVGSIDAGVVGSMDAGMVGSMDAGMVGSMDAGVVGSMDAGMR